MTVRGIINHAEVAQQFNQAQHDGRGIIGGMQRTASEKRFVLCGKGTGNSAKTETLVHLDGNVQIFKIKGSHENQN